MSALYSSLREAWDLEADLDDEYGVSPDAASRATLPRELSHVLDGARDHLAVPRLQSTTRAGPMLSTALREALPAPALARAKEPLPFPLLHQYARFWREGVRTDHEDEVRRLGIMTGEAVLAAVATGEQRWIDRAADGMMLLCELSTWCWVAHEQSYDVHGWVVPDPQNPVVDLGAAQTLQVLAWADLALGDALDHRVPGLRQRVRREARVRVFDPYLVRRDWHWLHGKAHNWTGWIHQHLIAGAVLLLQDADERGMRDAILALSIAQLDRYLASFPADGGIDEGFSYFWNGACRLLEAIELLGTASGGALAVEATTEIPVIQELIRFPHRMALGHGWFVNVADGPARPPAEQPWDVLHRWGRRLQDTDVVAGALAHRGSTRAPPVVPKLGLGRVLVALGDAAWQDAGVAAEAPLPREVWLPDVQILVAREREGDTDGLALCAKGGHNDEAHNHLDIGSYLVALDASPVLIDLGQPTYTAHTFTDRRYEIWTMTSSWHNLPDIRGQLQGIGARYRARSIGADLGDAGERSEASATSALALELASAYPAEAGVRSYRRTVSLDRAGPVGAAATIRDVWRLDAEDDSGTSVVLNQVLAGTILAHETGLLRVRALSGAVADLRWDAGVGTGELETVPVGDPLLALSWGETVHRLRLPARTSSDGHGHLTLTVRRHPSTSRRHDT